jgi:glucose/arabinose dehydrogenase
VNLTLPTLLAAVALALALPAAAQTAAKPAMSKAAAKPAAKKKPVAKAAPVELPPPAANDEQKAAATLAHLGEYACEFDQTVLVEASPKHEGYLDIKLKTQSWVMKPVLSSTGALRLEDVKGRMLMIQIANKSMVMDTQLGQRVVDGCMHAKQREFASTMDATPREAILK